MGADWVTYAVATGATVGNQLYVGFTTSGLNSFAVFFSFAKSILADQNLGGGVTLYGVLDQLIEFTKYKG